MLGKGKKIKDELLTSPRKDRNSSSDNRSHSSRNLRKTSVAKDKANVKKSSTKQTSSDPIVISASSSSGFDVAIMVPALHEEVFYRLYVEDASKREEWVQKIRSVTPKPSTLTGPPLIEALTNTTNNDNNNQHTGVTTTHTLIPTSQSSPTKLNSPTASSGQMLRNHLSPRGSPAPSGGHNRSSSGDQSPRRSLSRKASVSSSTISLNAIHCTHLKLLHDDAREKSFLVSVEGVLMQLREFVIPGGVIPPGLPSLFERLEKLESLSYSPFLIRYYHHNCDGHNVRLFVQNCEVTMASMLSEKRIEVEAAYSKEETPLFYSSKVISNWMSGVVRGLLILLSNSLRPRELSPASIFLEGQLTNSTPTPIIGALHNVRDFMYSDNVREPSSSLRYSAPESLKSHSPSNSSFSTEVWSIGMMIYELISLRRPYQEYTLSEITSSLIAESRPVVSEKVRLRYPTLADLYHKCTHPNPLHRPSLDSVLSTLSKL